MERHLEGLLVLAGAAGAALWYTIRRSGSPHKPGSDSPGGGTSRKERRKGAAPKQPSSPEPATESPSTWRIAAGPQGQAGDARAADQARAEPLPPPVVEQHQPPVEQLQQSVAAAADSAQQCQAAAASAAAEEQVKAAEEAAAATEKQRKAAASEAEAEQQRKAAAAAVAEQQRRAAEAAAARRWQSPLYRVTPNELVLHDLLLTGQEGGLSFLDPSWVGAAHGSGGEAAPGTAAAAVSGVPPMASGLAGSGQRSSSEGSRLPALPSLLQLNPTLAAAVGMPLDQLTSLQEQIKGTVERAFFDALADGLRQHPPQTSRLAALLLDARDQLAGLLPRPQEGGGRSGSRSEALLLELHDKLDVDYVEERLQQYDPAYCAQCFDFLVSVIARLQAPARQSSTKQQYAEVAALFATAAAAEQEAAAAAAAEQALVADAGAPGAADSSSSKAVPASTEQEHVRLCLKFGNGGGGVAVQLVVALPGPAAAAGAPASGSSSGSDEGAGQHWELKLVPSSGGDTVAAQLVPAHAAADAAAAAGSSGEGPALQWQLKLVPSSSGDGSITAMLAPVVPGAEAAPAAVPGQEGAEQVATGTSSVTASRAARGMTEASVAAVVAAARFMHCQLSELKADVAAARLAILKEAIIGSGSGIAYERQRFERALQAAAEAAAASLDAGEAAPGSSASTASTAADATVLCEEMPLTFAWLGRVMREVPPPAGLDGATFIRACVTAGLLLLLQSPDALGTAVCPETLLLDLGHLVGLQNELQRICLTAASLLIVQQIVASTRTNSQPLPAPSAAQQQQHQQFCQRLVRRMGALLSSGTNLEALAAELHQQAQHALALQQQQAQQGTGAGGAAAAGAASGMSVDLGMVRRMVARIFSTQDAVYRRVQAGMVSAMFALFSAALSGGAPAPAGREAPAAWRRKLRSIGADELAPEVFQLAAALDRIAAVSTAVAAPYYQGMLGQLRQEQQEQQQQH